jgi:hypothetical protein
LGGGGGVGQTTPKGWLGVAKKKKKTPYFFFLIIFFILDIFFKIKLVKKKKKFNEVKRCILIGTNGC